MAITRRVLAFLPLAALSLLASCTRGGGPGDDVLNVQLQAEPVSLDPALAEDGHAIRILENTMHGLVGYDENGKLELRIAKSYRVSPDGLKVEFALREDALWSDGRPVTAEQFARGLRRSMDPAIGARLSALLLPIRGAAAFRAGKKDAALGIRAEGNRLTFELERPAAYFVEALTLPVALPVRDDVLSANGGRWPVGAPSTGPYYIAAQRTGQYLRLKPSPRYYRAAEFPDALPVRLQLVQDESTASSLFEKGKLDILTRVPAFDLARLRRIGVVDVSPFLATYYVAFNVRKKPFDDVRWRRAVAASIRKEEIAVALQTGETAAWSWVPRGLEGFQPYREVASAFEADVEKVRAEALAMKRRPRIRLLFDGNSRNQMVMEKVQKDVESGLGLRLTLDNMDWKSFVRTLHSDPPAMYRFAWLAPFADPITHLQVFTRGNANNFTGWSDARYDALVEEIAALPKGAERRKKILQAQRILLEDQVPVVPLFHYVQVHAVRKNVKAFKVNPFGVIHFERLRKKG